MVAWVVPLEDLPPVIGSEPPSEPELVVGSNASDFLLTEAPDLAQEVSMALEVGSSQSLVSEGLRMDNLP